MPYFKHDLAGPFKAAEGCLEHIFVLQEMLDNARRRGSELCIAWLDLANAFGSVSHSALTKALKSEGFTQDQLYLISDLNEGSATAIRHTGSLTKPIDFNAGVRQCCRCPLYLSIWSWKT